jgi:hypothetical protein
MSTPDFRALCKELVDALAEWQLGGGPPEDTADADLIARARAILARWGTPAIQPVPVAPVINAGSERLRLVAGGICPEHLVRDMKNDLHPEVEAAYAYVDRVLHTADIQAGLSPAWYGWALREAFLAGCSHAAALAQPEPVAISKRLPEPEDCNAEGRCWLCGTVEGDWRLMNPANSGLPQLKYCFSHWLPHWALPVPTPANTINQEDYDRG